MKKHYFYVFILIVFSSALDAGCTQAQSQPPQTMTKFVVNALIPPEESFPPIDYPFVWDGTYYKDANTRNDKTNLETIAIDTNTGTKKQIAFYSAKLAYYRFEVAQFRLKGELDARKCTVAVTKDGLAMPCYKGPTNLAFVEDKDGATAYWFYGWNTPTGTYEATLYSEGKPVMKRTFETIARTPVKFKRSMSFITLEANTPMVQRKAFGPDGVPTGFTNALAEWMDYGNVDGFINLSGQTTGWSKATPENPWEEYPPKNLETIGKMLRKKGKIIGGYIMCFYTPSKGWKKGGYQSAMGLGGFGLTESQFVSFRDEKRFRDIAKLAADFEARPYVDMIGFDFIRFGENVGLELCEEFVRDMNIVRPANWEAMNAEVRAAWLGREMRHSGNLKDRWKLWQAHKTADFIYRVRLEAKITKPIWVFTLGWNHGMEHQQDPGMFQDAGALMEAVMLYEIDSPRFESMATCWREYLASEKVNFLPGNQIDAVLHRNSIQGFNAVEEYIYRLKSGADFAAEHSVGMFVHDSLRAFWGRRGEYSYYEWLNAGMEGISYLRFVRGESPVRLEVLANETKTEGGKKTVAVAVSFNTNYAKEILGKTLTIESKEKNILQKFDITVLTNIKYYITFDSHQNDNHFIALRGTIGNFPPYICIKYLQKTIVLKTAKNDKSAEKKPRKYKGK